MKILGLRAFLKEMHLPNSAKKFAAMAYFLAHGQTDTEVLVKDIKKKWVAGLLKIKYHSMFYTRAQENKYVYAVEGKKGVLILTDEGINKINELRPKEEVVSREIKKTGTLYIVNRTGSHSFDKLLRNIFSGAKLEVLLADPYVNETIFDNIMDCTPKSSIIKLLYNHIDDEPKFESRVKRFKTEYQKFELKRYKDLHDRFVAVDNVGYMLGPSIKDAATKSPALVVVLGGKETISLIDFFKSLWKISK
jgi:hypothetical protein